METILLLAPATAPILAILWSWTYSSKRAQDMLRTSGWYGLLIVFAVFVALMLVASTCEGGFYNGYQSCALVPVGLANLWTGVLALTWIGLTLYSGVIYFIADTIDLKDRRAQRWAAKPAKKPIANPWLSLRPGIGTKNR